MENIRFRVTHADGRVEEFVTESAQVMVGSGAHCEIRLPVGDARLEHVLFQSSPAGVRAVARSFDPPPVLDGVEFTQVPVRGESVLTLGKIRVVVLPGGPGAGQVTAARSGAARSPRLYVYLAAGIAGCAILIAAKHRKAGAAAEPATAPNLFTHPAVTCPQSSAVEATVAATTRVNLATQKEERSPFHPEDGVAAVGLYREAEACFRVAGDDDAATTAGDAAQRLEHRTTEEFRFHRIRLKRAVGFEEWDSAEREASTLLSFFPSGEGEYATWLTNLRRKIQVTHKSKKSP